MKALSMLPEYATQIVFGAKNKEYRTWKTDYRGDLIIHANKKISKEDVGYFVSGHAVAIVELYDILKGRDRYIWRIRNIRPIKPIKINGQQGLFNIDDNLINYLDINNTDELVLFWASLNLIDIKKIEGC